MTSIYPGADANTLEQSVTTPLEQQISGVDNMNYMQLDVRRTTARRRITVTFDIATDPNVDQVLTQMRSSAGGLAACRSEVNTYGVIVQKSMNSPMMFVSVYSPDAPRATTSFSRTTPTST